MVKVHFDLKSLELQVLQGFYMFYSYNNLIIIEIQNNGDFEQINADEFLGDKSPCQENTYVGDIFSSHSCHLEGLANYTTTFHSSTTGQTDLTLTFILSFSFSLLLPCYFTTIVDMVLISESESPLLTLVCVCIAINGCEVDHLTLPLLSF